MRGAEMFRVSFLNAPGSTAHVAHALVSGIDERVNRGTVNGTESVPRWQHRSPTFCHTLH